MSRAGGRGHVVMKRVGRGPRLAGGVSGKIHDLRKAGRKGSAFRPANTMTWPRLRHGEDCGQTETVRGDLRASMISR